MPIYCYQCPRCQPDGEGPPIEILVRIQDADKEQQCVVCGSTLKKVPALSEFHLKGVGWAKHGYTKQHPNVAKANRGRPSRKNYK